MGVFRDLTGQKFGFLIVLQREDRHRTNAVWRCRCDCGNDTLVASGSLVSGNTKSCGCGIARRSHGHAVGGYGKVSPTYSSWKSMVGRCTMPSNAGFAHYQKLGITICERWLKFENFLADMGERPSLAYTLDRYPDQAGNYEPGNCRWATRREQANNRSTNRLFDFEGERLTYREIARRTGLSDELLHSRLLRSGWSVEDAVKPERVPGKRPHETMVDIARRAGVDYRRFAKRVRAGWSIEDAIARPVRIQRRPHAGK